MLLTIKPSEKVELNPILQHQRRPLACGSALTYDQRSVDAHNADDSRAVYPYYQRRVSILIMNGLWSLNYRVLMEIAARRNGILSTNWLTDPSP